MVSYWSTSAPPQINVTPTDNHVLPTSGSARFAGALRVDDFCKHIHAVVVPPEGLRQVAPHVEALADYEGLPAHAESLRLRSQDAGQPA